MEGGRRKLIKGSIAAGALFLPQPWAWVWAQDSREGALKLLKAPKVALVVGNGKYKDAPELKNAPNDAKAIAETLKGAGFAVTMLLDAGREALIQAIRDYVNGMEKQKAVGLFYFAGHGVQLEWRNYMLPIDAVIDKIEDVAKQSVDVARLMEGLTKAANPMNVIILFDPMIRSSANSALHLGVSKAGSRMLRYLVVEAVHTAIRYDENLKRFYQRVAERRGRPKAKVAAARKLLVRAYIMLRDEIDYAEFNRRAVAARLARRSQGPPSVPEVLIGQSASPGAKLAPLPAAPSWLRVRSAGSYGESELNLMDDDRIDD